MKERRGLSMQEFAQLIDWMRNHEELVKGWREGIKSLAAHLRKETELPITPHSTTEALTYLKIDLPRRGINQHNSIQLQQNLTRVMVELEEERRKVRNLIVALHHLYEQTGEKMPLALASDYSALPKDYQVKEGNSKLPLPPVPRHPAAPK